MAEQPTAEKKETPGSTAGRARSRSGVTLRVRYPHVLFDLSGVDLPSVTPEGTKYTAEQADAVRTLAVKHGVPVYEVAAETTDEEK